MIDIEPMSVEHLDQVYEIELDSFSIPWSKRDIADEISNNKLAIYIVAICDGAIVGYGGMWHVINEGHITNIAVKRAYRGKGIGDMLLKALIRIGEEKEMIGLTLEVRVGNTTAMRLYSGNGFKVEGIRKNYYADTKEDAVIMWKHI